jgi:hypothetical protein
MNLLSLSLTMVLGRPCSLKISLKNSSTTYVELISVAMEKKCANFVNLSTTTKMQSFPYVFGNPSDEIHGYAFPLMLWNGQGL